MRLCAKLALAALLGAVRLASAQEANLAAVDKGIAQVHAGEFEEALVNLDLATRALAASPSGKKDLARVYLYMGAAYVGLGQEGLARTKLRQALRADPELRPEPSEFPNRVLRAFDAARRDQTEASGFERQIRKSRKKGGLLLLGVGAAAAVGVGATVVTRERDNQSPTASFTVSPAGQAIGGVTTMTFVATASDPEGDPLTISWDFGNRRSAFGTTVSLVFPPRSEQEQHTVTLSVRDGLSTTSVSGRQTVRKLEGRWRTPALEPFGVSECVINHPSEYFLVGTLDGPGFSGHFFGSVQDPRRVGINGSIPGCSLVFSGDAQPDLQSIVGSARCSGPGGCRCAGRTIDLTLIRQ